MASGTSPASAGTVREGELISAEARTLYARRNDHVGMRFQRNLHRAIQVGMSAALTLALAALGVGSSGASDRALGDDASSRGGGAAKGGPGPAKPPAVKLGLVINEPGAFPGCTLINTMNSKKAYLIDLEGRVVHTWQADTNSVHCAYFLKNGHLLRPADLGGAEKAFGGGPGAHGRIQEYTWEGELVWDFKLINDKQLSHHDVTRMPNGNILMIVWDKKSAQEAIAAGRKKELVGNYLLPDSIVEVRPTGKTTGEVVWEWHLWDHLVQDHDSSLTNYGNVADHPELVDLNYVHDTMAPVLAKKDGVDKLKSIGYVGSPKSRSERVNPDWTHFNSVSYNAELDQIMVSAHEFSEIWIIDHGTTKAEAAAHEGGRQGKGGDLLYRWGNPRVYRAGTLADQRLFAQHDAHWIPRGLPGAGHVLVFNNGPRRPDGTYSSVDEIVLPVDEKGRYPRQPGTPYGPDKAIWSYSAPKKADFYSSFISGAHRLPNGNTQICSGANGTVFEVTPDKRIVWKYVNPAKGGIRPGGPGGPPPPNQVLPPFLQDDLKLTPEQKKELEAIQKEVDDTLDKTLTDAQKKQLKQGAGFPPGPGGPPGPGAGPGPGPGPRGFVAPPQPGQIIATTTQVALKPTPEQRKKLGELQKAVDARLDKMFTEDQKKQFQQMRKDFARGGPPGFGPGPGGPGGPPPFLFAGPPGGASLFRAYRYGRDYPGLAGKELKAGKSIEEIEKKESEKK
jgi:hypothetical protein